MNWRFRAAIPFIASYLAPLAFLILGCGSLASQPQPAAPAPRKVALLVGINHYKAQQIPTLEGPINDVHRMQALLVGKFGFAPEDVVLLTDKEATHAGIVNHFRSITQRANPGDIVIFHFSGHGSQMMDDAEDDGWDETIVPSDSRQGNVFDISDKELNDLIGDLVKKTPFITVILDSCHSGTGIRDIGPGHMRGVRIREIPRDERQPPALPAGARALPEGRSDFRPLGAKYVLISAAASYELANEATFEGMRMGALSYFLTRHLESSDQSSTYRDIVDQSAAEISAMFSTQHAQLEGASDTVIFGIKEISPTYYFPVVRVGNGIGLSAGSISGLSVGSALDIYPPGTKDLKDPSKKIAMAKVTRVSTFDADLQKTGGNDIPIAARAVLQSRRFADSTIRIGLVGFPESERVRIAAALRKVDAVEVVNEQSKATLLVNTNSCCYFVSGGDLAPLSPAIHTADPDAVDHLVRQVEGWSRWFGVSELNNPNSPFPVRFSGVPRTVKPGEHIDIKVENLSTRDLFVTLLDLSSDGSIAVMNPATAPRDILGAGRTTTIGVRMALPEGRSSGVDTFKLLATVRPIDPGVFTQAAVKAVPVGPEDPLARLLRQTLARSKNGSPEPLGEWAIIQQSTTVSEVHGTTASNFRFFGYTAYFVQAEKTRALPGEPQCFQMSGGQNCYTVADAGVGGAMELKPVARSRAADDLKITPHAWDDAYELREKLGAQRVEPQYESSDEPGDAEARRSIGEDSCSPGDPQWNHHHVHSQEAWDQLRALGVQPGNEGATITIAHLDTGFTRHPEVWNQDETKSSFLYQHGFNYMTGTEDATDPLDNSGIIPNPGHGTKSGSVIASPAGKQWTGGTASDYVDGMAPGTHLLPLRVNRSVVNFNPSNLARAISDVAANNTAHVKVPAQVISIAMGGPPTFGLWHAVKAAREKGILVIAAAGNYVGFVVWPARFADVISVTATNNQCSLWSGASRGKVDIAAPGEEVVRADLDSQGDYRVCTGAGTTFATATTSGIAALWLQYQGLTANADLDRLRNTGQLTDEFRAALAASAWLPSHPAQGLTCTSTSWDPSDQGPGILDAKELLKPLPAGATRALTRESAIPLFESLLPLPSADAADAKYGQLFRANKEQPLDDLVPFETEIVFHYYRNPEVRTAFDAFLRAPVTDSRPAASARQTLLDLADLSAHLRTALSKAPAGG